MTPLARDDYDRLLDPAIVAFVARTERWFPPETASLPIGEVRAIYGAMCRAFHPGRPPGVRAEDGTIAGRPSRTYRMSRGAAVTVLYFHGGGFILGDLDSHDDVCAALCAATGLDVVSIDYRLAPEHPHPAAFDDALAAFSEVAAPGRAPVVLCGESAGGNLAAAVAHASRRIRHGCIGQVLIYPSLGGPMAGGSYDTHRDAPMLTVRDLAYYRDARFGGAPAVASAATEPLGDDDFTRLPPTVVVTAECDPLSSDGERYRDRIQAAGGRATWREEPGLVHSFLRACPSSERAARAFDRIAADITAFARGGLLADQA